MESTEKKLPPFLGYFEMSPLERSFHCVLNFLMGCSVIAYKIWLTLADVKVPMHEDVLYKHIAKGFIEMESWFVLPFFIVSYLLLVSIVFPFYENENINLLSSLSKFIFRIILGFFWFYVYIALSQLLIVFFYYNLPV